MKKVSIIVPVYNVEKYLNKCLDSLVNQTLTDIEIIVVNDGSPDNSKKIIDKYLKDYPDKIKYFEKENGGQGSARNLGLTKATGEYIGYVDSDDYVSVEMYEKMYQKAKENDADIVMCSHTIVYEDSGKEMVEKLFLKTNDNKTNCFFNNAGVCNKIYKKELLSNFEFRSKVWYEDIDFVTKVIMNANKIDVIDEGLYYYLLRQGSTMNNNNIEKNLDILKAFDSILTYLKENKKFAKYYEEVAYLAINHIYIAPIVRVINAKNVTNKKIIIDKLIKYMNDNFKDYRHNKYLYLLDRNKRIIYNLINNKQYWLIKLIFSVKGIIK